MTRTNELEAGLRDVHRSWSRIRPLIRRTLFDVIMKQHDDVINYIIEEFSERIGIRTMDSRIIPATTGGLPKEFYDKVSRIPDTKKDEAYPAILQQILQETQPQRQLMLTGMQYQLLKDYFVEDTQIKPGNQYVKEEIEFEMRNGDGSYRRHVPKMYAEQIASQVVQLSALGKDKLIDMYNQSRSKNEKLDAEPQSRLILSGQMQQAQQRPQQRPQQPKQETKSGLIIANLEDIRKYTH